MKFTLIACIFSILFCLASSQMTFTDQWAKKRTAFENAMLAQRSAGSSTGSEEFECSTEKVQRIVEQLERLAAAQQKLVDYLAACYKSPQPQQQKA